MVDVCGPCLHAGRLLGFVNATPPAPAGPFTARTLSIHVKSAGVTWRPGASSDGNLMGTISSWNEVEPADLGAGIQAGVLSRDGWTLLDDTATPRFGSMRTPNASKLFLGLVRFRACARACARARRVCVLHSLLHSRHAAAAESGRFRSRSSPPSPPRGNDPLRAHPWMPRSAPWVDVSGARPAPLVDWYFLGCGADYKGCLADYAAMAGKIPIPPKASLGIWWSHFEAYSAHSIQKDVLSGFKNFSLPLNVLQMDVDWHFRNPRLNPKCSGFNGYDWNTGLFPDPIGYVATVARGNWSAAVAPAPATPLRLILNSHNMLGVDECQAEYTAVAADAGHDVSNGSAVPFNTSDLATMTAM